MSSRLKEVAKKKENILSKILKVDMKSLKAAKVAKRSPQSLQSVSSSYDMDTKVIANIQERINNPLFNITIADYELMCDNKIITKMMSKVLECDEKKLKKFCKYINVFKENINSSPKSIKNKMKPKLTINNLPEELRTQIVEKYKSLFPTKYVLKDWIPLEKLDWWELSENPNAIELLKANPEKIYWWGLSKNPNPEAIELLQKNIHEINWDMVSKNPNAIELLKKYPENISWHYLSKNPNQAAIELLKANPKKIEWRYLSKNRNPEAIELLKANPDKIDWDWLSRNPSIFDEILE